MENERQRHRGGSGQNQHCKTTEINYHPQNLRRSVTLKGSSFISISQNLIRAPLVGFCKSLLNHEKAYTEN